MPDIFLQSPPSNPANIILQVGAEGATNLYRYRLDLSESFEIGSAKLLFEQVGDTDCESTYTAEWRNRHPFLGRGRTRFDLLPGWRWPTTLGTCPPQTVCILGKQIWNTPEVQVIWWAQELVADWNGYWQAKFVVVVDDQTLFTDDANLVTIDVTSTSATEADMQAELDRLIGAGIVTCYLFRADNSLDLDQDTEHGVDQGMAHYALVLVFSPGASYNEVLMQLVRYSDESGITQCTGFIGGTHARYSDRLLLNLGLGWDVTDQGCDPPLNHDPDDFGDPGTFEWPTWLRTCTLGPTMNLFLYPVEGVEWSNNFSMPLIMSVGTCTASGSETTSYPAYDFYFLSGAPGTTATFDLTWDVDCVFTENGPNDVDIELTLTFTIQQNTGGAAPTVFTAVYEATGVSFSQLMSLEDFPLLLSSFTSAGGTSTANKIVFGSTATVLCPVSVTISGHADVSWSDRIFWPVTQRLQKGGDEHNNEFQVIDADYNNHAVTFEGQTSGTIYPADSPETIAGTIGGVVGSGDVRVYKALSSRADAIRFGGPVGTNEETFMLQHIALYIAEFISDRENSDVEEMTISTGLVETVIDGGPLEPVP